MPKMSDIRGKSGAYCRCGEDDRFIEPIALCPTAIYRLSTTLECNTLNPERKVDIPVAQ